MLRPAAAVPRDVVSLLLVLLARGGARVNRHERRMSPAEIRRAIAERTNARDLDELASAEWEGWRTTIQASGDDDERALLAEVEAHRNRATRTYSESAVEFDLSDATSSYASEAGALWVDGWGNRSQFVAEPAQRDRLIALLEAAHMGAARGDRASLGAALKRVKAATPPSEATRARWATPGACTRPPTRRRVT